MRSLYLASVWLHILAAMTWVGGMVVFVVALMPFLRGQSGVDDVQAGFGRSLEDFLGAPTGTMSMALASRIVLDTSGRLVAIEKLKEAHALYRQQSEAARPVPSH